jgi:hypothetical protein
VRVSDADRESTVDRLRQASTEGLLDLDEYADRVGRAYEARSRADLDRVVDDLPVPAPPAPVGVARGVRWTVAVFSSHKRNGPWRPAPETRVLAVLGSCRIDLTDIDPADLGDELEIRAIAVLGGIEVLVPGGVAVELGGFAFVGSRDYRVRRTSPVGDRPVVRVRANAWFGGVTVRSRPDPVP